MVKFAMAGAAAKKKSAPPQPKAAKVGGSPKKKFSFAFSGGAAKEEVARADAAQEAAREAANRPFTFWIREGEEAQVTFLDGDLDEDGDLDIYYWYQHTVNLAGNWTPVICTSREEPCPACQSGDRASLVGCMTVINHTPYKIRKGPRAGEVIGARRMLFVASRKAIKILTKHARKLGGLRYVTFDVERTDPQSPRVGDIFTPLGKSEPADLAKQLGGSEKPVPFDLEEAVTYRTREELLEMGIGGHAAATAGDTQPAKELDSDIPF